MFRPLLITKALSLGALSASQPQWLLAGDSPHPTQAAGTHTPREPEWPGDYVPWGSPYQGLMGVGCKTWIPQP